MDGSDGFIELGFLVWVEEREEIILFVINLKRRKKGKCIDYVMLVGGI